MTLRALTRAASRCLGEEVSDYVAGRLDGVARRRCERHLVSCQLCRTEVEQERRLRVTLRRSTPGVPGDLRDLLLAVPAGPRAGGSASDQGRRRDGRGTSQAAPCRPTRAEPSPGTLHVGLLSGHMSRRHDAGGPVPVLSPQAPACHRSALRSTVLATLAAGVTAAAAWGLAVSGAAPAGAGQPAPGASRGPAAPFAQGTGAPVGPSRGVLGAVTVWFGPSTWSVPGSSTPASPLTQTASWRSPVDVGSGTR